MKARRSGKDRQQVFAYFRIKSQMPSPLSARLYGSNKHEVSEQKHQAMLDKAKVKFLAKIKAWLKAKVKSIFKVK